MNHFVLQWPNSIKLLNHHNSLVTTSFGVSWQRKIYATWTISLTVGVKMINWLQLPATNLSENNESLT